MPRKKKNTEVTASNGTRVALNPPDPDCLIDALRDAIEQNGISQNQLAAVAEVNQGTVSRFVTGTGGLNLTSAGRLASVLGLKLVVDPKQAPNQLSPR